MFSTSMEGTPTATIQPVEADLRQVQRKWSPVRATRVRLLGQLCVLSVWNKPG